MSGMQGVGWYRGDDWYKLKDGTKVVKGEGKNARGGQGARFGWYVSIHSKEHFADRGFKHPCFQRTFYLNNTVGHDMVAVATQCLNALAENYTVRSFYGIEVKESKYKMSG